MDGRRDLCKKKIKERGVLKVYKVVSPASKRTEAALQKLMQLILKSCGRDGLRIVCGSIRTRQGHSGATEVQKWGGFQKKKKKGDQTKGLSHLTIEKKQNRVGWTRRQQMDESQMRGRGQTGEEGTGGSIQWSTT